MMTIAPFIIGCSSRIEKPHLLPTDRMEIEFVKNDKKYCASGDDIISLSNTIENLRENQRRLIRAIDEKK